MLTRGCWHCWVQTHCFYFGRANLEHGNDYNGPADQYLCNGLKPPGLYFKKEICKISKAQRVGQLFSELTKTGWIRWPVVRATTFHWWFVVGFGDLAFLQLHHPCLWTTYVYSCCLHVRPSETSVSRLYTKSRSSGEKQRQRLRRPQACARSFKAQAAAHRSHWRVSRELQAASSFNLPWLKKDEGRARWYECVMWAVQLVSVYLLARLDSNEILPTYGFHGKQIYKYK